jgi:hypothetical protein
MFGIQSKNRFNEKGVQNVYKGKMKGWSSGSEKYEVRQVYK